MENVDLKSVSVISVIVIVTVFGFVFVFVFGSKFFFFFLVGPRIGPNPLTEPIGPGWGGFGAREKNPLS